MSHDIEVVSAVREYATIINSFLDDTDSKENFLSEVLISGAFNNLKTMAGPINIFQG